MGSKRVMVTWDSHQSTFLKGLQQLLFDEIFTDVTLVCENNSLKTHKAFLVAMSSFFQDLFTADFKNCCIVNIENISYHFLREIITLMYLGEVTLLEDQLSEFFKVAEYLQVKGFNDNSVYNVLVTKKLVSNEKVNVEFIEKTIEHDQVADLKEQEDSENAEWFDDDSFIDPSTIVKQEIIEGNMPILTDAMFTEEKDCHKPEDTLSTKSIGKEQTHCNSVGSKTGSSVKDSSSEIQGDEPISHLLLRSRRNHLDSQHKASDQHQEASNSDKTTKNSSNKQKKRYRKKELECPADSISSRTRSNQVKTSTLHRTLTNKSTSNEQGSRDVNGTKELLLVLKNKNLKLKAAQNKNGKKTNSVIQSNNHLNFQEWFTEAKKYPKTSLRTQLQKSLSLFQDVFSESSDDDSNSAEVVCPVHGSPSDQREKEIRSLVNYVYECGKCCRKFGNRINYLMHLKLNHKYSSLVHCTCSSSVHKRKRGRKPKCFGEKYSNVEQSYEPNIEQNLSRKTDQTSTIAISPFSCNSCGKTFFSKKPFLLHLESHTLYACPFCDKQYTKLNFFIQHQQSHNY